MKTEYLVELNDQLNGEFLSRLRATRESVGAVRDLDCLREVRDSAMGPAAASMLANAQAVGMTSALDAPSLVPFYDLQVVRLCSGCMSLGNVDPAATVSALAPMLEAGLVLPALTGPLQDYPPELARLVVKHPFLPEMSRAWFRALYASLRGNGNGPCVLCRDKDSCDLLTAVRERIGALSGDVDPDELERLMQIAEEGGTASAKLVLDLLEGAHTEDEIVPPSGLYPVWVGLDSLMFAATMDARAGVSGTALRGACGVVDSEYSARIAADVSNDLDLRLSIADHVGIAFDPTYDVSAYVAIVAPHAGALSRAIALDMPREDGEREAWGYAVEVAAAINASVRKIEKRSARYRTIGAALTSPFARVVGRFGLGLASRTALLASCAAGADAAQSLIPTAALASTRERTTQKRLRVPDKLLDAIEGLTGLASGAYSVHAIRKDLGHSRHAGSA